MRLRGNLTLKNAPLLITRDRDTVPTVKRVLFEDHLGQLGGRNNFTCQIDRQERFSHGVNPSHFIPLHLSYYVMLSLGLPHARGWMFI